MLVFAGKNEFSKRTGTDIGERTLILAVASADQQAE
jgi:hypothetical protein